MRSNQLSFAAIILALTAVFISIGFYTADRQPPTALGTALPEGSAIFETALQDRITSSDTSMTLVSTSTASGEALPNGDYCFTIDEGRTDTEFVCGTLGGNKQVTGLTRGLSSVTGTTTVTANKYVHRKGASVKITDYPLIQRMRNQLSGTETISGLLLYAGGVDCDGSSATTSLCTKFYVDSTVNQGAATSTESIAGIVRLATPTQAASSTDLGGDIPLALQAKYATDTPQRGCASGYEATAGAGCSVIALLTGKIKQSWLNLTDNFTWSGLHLFSGGASTTRASVFESLFVGGTATSTVQGSTTGTSTLQGFLNVSGTNSTSTFSGALSAGKLEITGACSGCWRTYASSTTIGSGTADTTRTYVVGFEPRVIHYIISASDANENAWSWGTWNSSTGYQTMGAETSFLSAQAVTDTAMKNTFTDGKMEVTFGSFTATGFTATFDRSDGANASDASIYITALR